MATLGPRRRLVLGIACLIGFSLTTGVAYAWWSAIGSGTASIGATTAAPLGVTSTVAPLADLYPGKTSDLALLVSNSNPYPVQLTTLNGLSVTSSDETGCPAADFVVLDPAVMTAVAAGGFPLVAPIAVPAGSGGTSATLPGLVTMSTTAPDACQGQTFTVSLSFSGSQV